MPVGRILRPHGLRGEVVVARFGDSAGLLEPGSRIRVGDVGAGGWEEGGAAIVVREARPFQAHWIVLVEGVRSRTEAQTLAGRSLFVSADELPVLSEGSYYGFQIVGLRAVTTEGAVLGTVREVLETGANDVYVVEGERGEVLLPAIADVIAEVDLAGGRLVVKPMPGLLDL